MKHVLLFESWEVLWFKQIIANGSWIQFNIECFLNDTQWHTKTLNWMNHHCMFGVCFLKSYSRIPRFFKFSHLGSGSLAGETETSTFCANRGVADGSWQGSTCCRRGHWAVFCFFSTKHFSGVATKLSQFAIGWYWLYRHQETVCSCRPVHERTKQCVRARAKQWAQRVHFHPRGRNLDWIWRSTVNCRDYTKIQ